MSLGGPHRGDRPHCPLVLLLLLTLASPRAGARLLALLPAQVPVGVLPPALASLPPLLPLGTGYPPHCAPPGLLGVGADGVVPTRGVEHSPCPLLRALPETTQLLLLGARPPQGPLTHFTLCRTAALHGAVGRCRALGTGRVAAALVQVQALLTLGAEVVAEAGLAVLNLAFDALVHVGVAGIEVSRWAGRQADAHLADVVPLQQDEQLGRALEAAVDLRTELTAFGTGLAPLGADPPLPLPLDPPAAGSEMHPAQNQGHHTQPKPHSHSPAPGPWWEGWSLGRWGGRRRALANASGAGSAAGGPGLGWIPNPP